MLDLRPSKKGFTLLEVLTVAGVSLLLFGLVIRIFFQSQDAVGHTVDKVESIQTARQLVDKLTPVVGVASDPSRIGGQPVTVHLPEDGLDEQDWSRSTWLDIVTTEDFLSPDFSTRKREFQTFADLRAHRYRIEYLPQDGTLVLKKMLEDLTAEDTSFKPRLLARNLAGLQFRPLINDDSLIEVRVRVEQNVTNRNVGSNNIIETSAALHVPVESLR